MKSPSEQIDTLKKLNSVDLEELKELVKEMNDLGSKEISTDNLVKIENVLRTLNAFREKYQYRVINLLKKGYLLS